MQIRIFASLLPVLGEDEMEKPARYREMLIQETTPRAPEEEEEVMKLKPSATAVGIALKNDRQVLSEKYSVKS